MYSSKNLDHLGIVSGVCKEIHLQEEIDNILGIDPRQKVTCGQAVKAMVLNSLGFVDRPLYLFPEFMKTKPIEILIEPRLEADDFNDDVLGRTLDKLYNAGCEEIFMRVAANAHEYGSNTRFFHSDLTSISVQGEYEHEEGDIDAVPIQITRGHSKEKRPDLKQFVISLITSRQLPTFIQALSGNTSGKNYYREITKKYGESLQEIWGKDRIWIWDSEVYTEKNLKAISTGFKWISRVPQTISDAKRVIMEADMEKMKKTSMDGYHLLTIPVAYGGVEQRWIVVFSEKAYKRETKTLDRRIKKEKEKVEKKLWHLSNQEFKCKEDGLQTLKEMEKKWKYHRVKNVRIKERNKKKNGGKGRPKKGEERIKLYNIKAAFEEDQKAIKRKTLMKGKFIVTTNELDEEKLTSEDALKAYKEQQYVERGFRFLKDPMFFAHSIFLEKEGRIVAMVMIMGLALLVYALAEKKLRRTLEEQDETLPDQKGKPTKRPTMRRTFQVFEGITVLYDEKGQMIEVMNLRETPRKVLSLFGKEFEKRYGIAT